jgi:hypothetical protein
VVVAVLAYSICWSALFSRALIDVIWQKSKGVPVTSLISPVGIWSGPAGA